MVAYFMGFLYGLLTAFLFFVLYVCVSLCKKGIKGTRQISKGDLYSRYANMPRAIMNTCGLGGIKLLVEVS
jgi:hypothetical protein